MISIDLRKAKEIAKAKLRKQRESALQALDVQFQRALETGSDTSRVVAEKNRLRDITKLVDQANSIEELSTVKLEAV